MRCLLAAAILGALISPAAAGVRYDHKLEEQVKQIIAAKIGDIRGTLAYDQILVFPEVAHVSEAPSFQILQSLPKAGQSHFQVIE